MKGNKGRHVNDMLFEADGRRLSIEFVLNRELDEIEKDTPRRKSSTEVKFEGVKYGNRCTDHPEHNAQPVKIGPYTIFAGGTRDITAKGTTKADILVPLLSSMPQLYIGRKYEVISCPMTDMGGVPSCWKEFLEEDIIPVLESGKSILVFCLGGHGRTGTFLASLIALLEPEIKDPIAEIRERYCDRAVESMEQIRAIFALKGEEPPKKYSSASYHTCHPLYVGVRTYRDPYEWVNTTVKGGKK